MSKWQMFWVLAVGSVVALATYAAFALAPKSALTIRTVTQTSDRSAAAARPAAMPVRPPSRPALAAYKENIGESLFTAPQPKMHPAPLQQKQALPPAAPQLPVMPPNDPLADAVYSGSVTMDGKTTALIESRSTKQGVYVDEGEEWQGFRVLAVSPEEVSLSVNGTTRRLAKSDTINLVPLSANAPGSTPGVSASVASQGQPGGEPQSAAMAMKQTFMIQESGLAVERLKILTDSYQSNVIDYEIAPMNLSFDKR